MENHHAQDKCACASDLGMAHNLVQVASSLAETSVKAASSLAQALPQNLSWLQRLAKSYNIIYSPEVLDLHQRPLYLVRAAKAKYGQDIFVLGATQWELARFWEDTVNYRAIEISEEPTPKGRTIVDIDTKSHLNDREEDEEVDAPDRNDQFEITSTKGSTHSNTKTYQLKFDETYTYQAGGMAHFEHNCRLAVHIQTYCQP